MELNKIYNEDCLEGMKRIPDGSIDLIVTDPPYRNISGGKPHKKEQPSGILSKNDGKIFEFNDINPESWFPELYRVLKSGGHCYVMTNTINLEAYLRLARQCKFGLHSVLVWKKNNATPNRWYMKNGEYVLFLRKGKAKQINDCGSKQIHNFPNIIGKKSHPTEKPVALMEFYIKNSSQPLEIVFDPFMGSGSTAVASINTGRNFIGFEIDKGYYNIANKRINEAKEKNHGNLIK